MASVMFAHKGLFLDRDAVKNAIRAAGQDPQRMQRAGGLIRSEARRSMRYVKKKTTNAPPGSPPRAHEPEPNLRSIVFFWSPLLRMMAVGAPPFPGGSSQIQNVPEVHERGGKISQLVRLRLFKPPRNKSGRPATRKQLAALKRRNKDPESRLLRTLAVLRQPLKRVIKNYPARPYMWPALVKILHRLPAIWKNSIVKFRTRHTASFTRAEFPGAAGRAA